MSDPPGKIHSNDSDDDGDVEGKDDPKDDKDENNNDDADDDNQSVASHSNDLVIRDGFPALMMMMAPPKGHADPSSKSSSKKKNKWWIDETDETMILPRWPFWSQDHAIQFFDDNHETTTTTTNTTNSSSPANGASSTSPPHQGQQPPPPQPPASLLRDCHKVFSARTRDDNASYSAGTTYFLPALMKPRCALEGLVQMIFQQHVKMLPDAAMCKPEQSGAEWWTLVLSEGGGEGGGCGDDHDNKNDNKKAQNDILNNNNNNKEKEEKDESSKSKQKPNGDTNEKKDDEGENDDKDDDDDDEVGWHYDADYGLEDQAPGLLLHPRVGTVTYLSDCGAPTVMLDCKTPPQGKVQQLHGRTISKAWISYPRIGKHAAFDGRLLHGAPANVFPSLEALSASLLSSSSSDPAKQNGSSNIGGSSNRNNKSKSNSTMTTTCSRDEEGQQPPPAKRAKVDDTTTTIPNGSGSQQQQQQNQRVTLLVNVWLNHCPLDAELLEDDILDEMESPWQQEEASSSSAAEQHKKQKQPLLFAWNSLANMAQEPDLLPATMTVQSTKTNNKRGGDDDDDDEEEEELEDEIVLCNHHVKVRYGARLEDYHHVAQSLLVGERSTDSDIHDRSTTVTKTTNSSSLVLDLAKGSLTLAVGDPVSSDSEAGEVDED